MFFRSVFVIKHKIEKDFKELIGDKIAKNHKVEYVFQEVDKLPNGFSVPEGREKPWGTGHAILCCKDVVKEPFMVINADDFYGAQSYKILADFLQKPASGDKMQFAMAAYILKNTLTENGSVSRGVAQVDDNDKLQSLVERTHIEIVDGNAAFSEDGGKTFESLDENTLVSMNAWAFPREMLEHLEELFVEFLNTTAKENPLKAEFYLPFAVNDMMKNSLAETTVFKTVDKWYGMTYIEDKEDVVNAIKDMTEKGIYPEKF